MSQDKGFDCNITSMQDPFKMINVLDCEPQNLSIDSIYTRDSSKYLACPSVGSQFTHTDFECSYSEYLEFSSQKSTQQMFRDALSQQMSQELGINQRLLDLSSIGEYNNIIDYSHNDLGVGGGKENPIYETENQQQPSVEKKVLTTDEVDNQELDHSLIKALTRLLEQNSNKYSKFLRQALDHCEGDKKAKACQQHDRKHRKALASNNRLANQLNSSQLVFERPETCLNVTNPTESSYSNSAPPSSVAGSRLELKLSISDVGKPNLIDCKLISEALKKDNNKVKVEEEGEDGDDVDDSDDHTLKHKRTSSRRIKKSPEQVQLLEEAYEKSEFLSVTRRAALAQRTGLSDSQIRLWFQYKRNITHRDKKTPKSAAWRTNK